MLLSHKLAYELTEPALYALEIKDLDASALLLSKRRKIYLDSDKFIPVRCSADAIDRMDLMDKFISVIAEQCDDTEAEKYIKHISKYADTLRRDRDGHYIYVGEDYVRKMYEVAKEKIYKI